MDSGDRLADYRAYYRSRAERRAADPLFPETAAAERAMADAVDAAGSIDELVTIAGELSAATGHALARDQARARAAVYEETAEDVRAQAPAEVLATVHSATDGPAVAAKLSDVERRNGLAVTADEAHRLWTSSITALENVEVWRTAEVPDRWRAELEQQAADAIAAARQGWASVEREVSQHAPGWTLDPAVARAERHRRLVPLADPVFEQRLAEHGAVVRGGGR